MRELAQAHRAGHARTALEGVQRPPQLPRAGGVAGGAAPRAHLLAGLRVELGGFLEKIGSTCASTSSRTFASGSSGSPVLGSPATAGRAGAPRARVPAPRDVAGASSPGFGSWVAAPRQFGRAGAPFGSRLGAGRRGAARILGVEQHLGAACSPGAAPRAPAGSRRPASRRQRRSPCARGPGRRVRKSRSRRRAPAAPWPAAAPSPAAAPTDTARAPWPSLRRRNAARAMDSAQRMARAHHRRRRPLLRIELQQRQLPIEGREMRLRLVDEQTVEVRRQLDIADHDLRGRRRAAAAASAATGTSPTGANSMTSAASSPTPSPSTIHSSACGRRFGERTRRAPAARPPLSGANAATGAAGPSAAASGTNAATGAAGVSAAAWPRMQRRGRPGSRLSPRAREPAPIPSFLPTAARPRPRESPRGAPHGRRQRCRCP